jgi:glyoxylate reductase
MRLLPETDVRKPVVIVTRKLPDVVEARLRELFDARLNDADKPFSRAELIGALKSCEILVPTITDRLDAGVLAEAGPGLKMIANYANGFDNIDITAALARGLTVTNTPGVLTEDTADATMALILSVPRRFFEGASLLERGGFRGWSPTWMLGERLRGKRLGIVGMGRIGEAVARRARPFGLAVHYHNRKPVRAHVETELEATYWENLDQMLPRVDIISINCPLTPATYRLLSARRLKLLKPTAYLVNTARGEIVDEEALAELLDTGKLAGAGLDVYQREPAIHPKLLKARNVVLLPHMASSTLEGRIEMGEKVIVNIKSFVDGHRPPDRVVPAML